jgi:hypothetical protein
MGMLSRPLSLATVTLLFGCFAAGQALAQNLEAGKSPAQIFAGACNACHKGPRGLLRTVPAGSLPGFLRQHYTTSGEMASLLSAFLVSNGAADTRFTGNQPKPGKDAKPEAAAGGSPEQLDRFGRKLHPRAPSQEVARPDGEPGEIAKPAPARTQAAIERGPDGRKLSAKQRLGKRGKPAAEEPPKTDAAKDEAIKDEAAKEEAARGGAAKEETPNGETAKNGDDKPEAAKPSGEGRSESEKSESAKLESAKPDSLKPESAKPAKPDSSESGSAKLEPPKEPGGGPVLRPDPVPPVTPAPATPPAVSAAVGNGASEPAVAPSLAPPQPAPPPAVTASVPPLPPVAPAGPPAPPISQ